jgi:hypothetical protein
MQLNASSKKENTSRSEERGLLSSVEEYMNGFMILVYYKLCHVILSFVTPVLHLVTVGKPEERRLLQRY